MGSSKDSRGLEDEYLVTWRYLEEGSLVGGIPTYPSEKYEEFVNWDHEIPNWMENDSPFMFQTTKQVYYIWYSHMNIPIESLSIDLP